MTEVNVVLLTEFWLKHSLGEKRYPDICWDRRGGRERRSKGRKKGGREEGKGSGGEDEEKTKEEGEGGKTAEGRRAEGEVWSLAPGEQRCSPPGHLRTRHPNPWEQCPACRV
jgi:hypothetical protein